MQWSEVLSAVQSVGLILAILVSFGTIKGKSDQKVVNMTKIETDLDYIKKAVECIPGQTTQLAVMQKSIETLEQRFNDHMALHRKEDNP